MSDKDKYTSFIRRIENLVAVRAVRNGLIHIIPVLIIGAFALILQTFPVRGYQDFISNALGGFFLKLLEIVYKATFGVLSVYMTYSISRAYMHLKADQNAPYGGAIIASLISFFILSGAYLPGFGTEQMGPKSMFLALITGLCASALYLYSYRFLQKHKKNFFLFVDNREIAKMISTLFPIILIAALFGLINALIVRLFGVDSFHELLINLFNSLFSIGGSGFFKGFFFVLLSSVLWFFGIHGSDTLEGVMQKYFAPGLAANQAAIEAGGVAETVLTKEFFDCFVLMGGCGATICLLIAILIFSRNKAHKGLGLAATFPMLFNINELMVFGLPVIFNPIMLIPFLAVPLVNYSVAYLAISTGIVPMITSSVEWTTPIFIGGYFATGSASGALLQLVNLIIGVLIYLPFVRLLDRQTQENAKKNFDSFMAYFKANEHSFAHTKVIRLGNVHGDYAKELCNDLRYGLKKQVRLAYQPQYNYSGKCIGVEALLRYEHPLTGMLYPPLVIKLSEEGGFLPELEEKILAKALEDRPALLERFGDDIKLSINVTGTTVVTDRYLNYCRKLNEDHPFKDMNVCIEITEQAAIAINDDTINKLRSLHDMGLLLAIDDFSMGQTSIHYLSDSLFDIIKLDGSLVSGLFTHKNSYDIVHSIVTLSTSLNMTVIAEFVDSEEKKKILHEIGCDNYQGYLYSPAVFLNDK